MFKALFFSQMRLIYYSMFAARRKKLARTNAAKMGSAAKKFGIAVLAIYVIGCMFLMFGVMLGQLCTPLLSQGLDSVYFVMAGLISFALMFVGSVFITQKQLFEATDNELLLSMPIPPVFIVLSRLLAVFTVNLIYSSFVYIPAIFLYFKADGFDIAKLGIFIVASLLMVLISLVFSVILGWGLALLTSNSRRKKLLTPILMFGLFFGYMYFYMNMQAVVSNLILNGADIAQALQTYFPPLYYYGTAVGDANIKAFALLAVITVALVALMLWLVSKSFTGIVIKNKGSVKYTYKERRLNASSPIKAMLIKECKRFLGSANYIFNSGVGSVFALVLAGAVAVKGAELISSPSFTEDMGPETLALITAVIPLAITVMLTFCASMNSTAAASLSLEGKQFALLRSMPLSYKSIVLPKILFNILWGVPPLFIASIICALRLKPSFTDTLLMILIPVIAQIFTAVWGMFCNIMFPKFDWINEVTVIKQSAATFFGIFGGIGLLGIYVVVMIVGMKIIPYGNGELDFIMAFAAPALLITYVLCALIVTVLLVTYGRKKFDSI